MLTDILKILMIEDNSLDAELIVKIIERSGINTATTVISNKKELMDALDEENFDIVLSDHSLPQFNSTEALKIIKERIPDLPFIVVTGTVSEEFAVSILHQGADDYILKNNLKRLPSAITSVIEKRKMQQARKKAEADLEKSNDELRLLASHLQNIREQERKVIAREIHDELGQQLTALKMDISWIAKKIQGEDDSVKQKIIIATGLIDETIKTVRKIATELRPSILDDLGLIETLRWHSQEFEKRFLIKIDFPDDINDIDIPKEDAIGLFRIYQESLTNIARHAKATYVKASIQHDDNMFVLTITDNGKGFEVDKVAGKKTLGLLGMKERILMMGGQYEIISSPGQGTTVRVSAPLRPKQ